MERPTTDCCICLQPVANLPIPCANNHDAQWCLTCANKFFETQVFSIIPASVAQDNAVPPQARRVDVPCPICRRGIQTSFTWKGWTRPPFFSRRFFKFVESAFFWALLGSLAHLLWFILTISTVAILAHAVKVDRLGETEFWLISLASAFADCLFLVLGDKRFANNSNTPPVLLIATNIALSIVMWICNANKVSMTLLMMVPTLIAIPTRVLVWILSTWSQRMSDFTYDITVHANMPRPQQSQPAASPHTPLMLAIDAPGGGRDDS